MKDYGYAPPRRNNSVYVLTRDGAEIMRGTEIAIWGWIHNNTSFSVFHATRHEGYSIERPTEEK